jgi:hypothetical protein
MGKTYAKGTIVSASRFVSLNGDEDSPRWKGFVECDLEGLTEEQGRYLLFNSAWIRKQDVVRKHFADYIGLEKITFRAVDHINVVTDKVAFKTALEAATTREEKIEVFEQFGYLD